jgi:hypothetical protein
MEFNAQSEDDDPDQAGAYWRRRAVTLVAGLGLIGLLVWAFSGGGKPTTRLPGTRPAAAYRSGLGAGAPDTPAATAASAASPGAPATGSAAPGLAATAPAASGSGTAAARASAGKAASGSPAAAAGQGLGQGGRCPSGAVVLSLYGSKDSYPAGQDPQFEIDVVSTTPGSCAFDLGPAALHLVVMAAGRVIWDSADCARGSERRAGGGPGRVTELSRGVPVRESVAWNRTISLPGCVTVAPAPPGGYQAQARAAGIASPVRAFRLQR